MKEFHEYIIEGSRAHVSHEDYLNSPATAFLKYTIEAKDAIDLCARQFPKNADGRYSQASLDSLQHLTVAVLPSIMGHLETFQRNLFAGLFDYSVLIQNFKVENFFENLKKTCSPTIDLVRLSAHRGIGASSIGALLADSLSGWHDPKRVNSYFNAFGLGHQLFSNDDCSKLSVLWQFRHSVVHTGGTITLPDAQKIWELKTFGGRQVIFEKNFIFEVSRKLHPIIKRSTEGIGRSFTTKMIDNIPIEVSRKIDKFFEVKSTISVWLR